MDAETDIPEREYQFDVADIAATERWVESHCNGLSLTLEPQSPKTQTDTYLDTEDWAVYRAGFALRIRHGDSGNEATLKALTSPGEDAQERREITQPFGGTSNGGFDGADGAVARRVDLIANQAPLHALFQIRTKRHDYVVRQTIHQIGILSLDESTVLKDGVEAGVFQRLEIEETVAGGLHQVESFVEDLRGACGLRPSSDSKFGEGLRRLGLSPEAVLDFGETTLRVDKPANEYALALMRRYFAQFVANEPGTRLGEDAAALHDMRVATRRLRATISLFKGALPARFEFLRSELKWIGAALGEVRDLDVFLVWLKKAGDEEEPSVLEPVVEELASSRDGARATLLAAMRENRYARLVAEMSAALRSPERAGQGASVLATEYLNKRLRKHYRKWNDAASRLGPTSEPASYHEVRVLLKHLRYGVEASQPIAPKKAERLIEAATAGQDLLGEHQDGVVTVARFRGLIRSHGPSLPPETIFRIGELAERRLSRMSAVRDAWPEVSAALRESWGPFQKALRRAASASKI